MRLGMLLFFIDDVHGNAVADGDHTLAELFLGVKQIGRYAHPGVGTQSHQAGIFEQNTQAAFAACPKLVGGIDQLLGLNFPPRRQRYRHHLAGLGFGHQIPFSG